MKEFFNKLTPAERRLVVVVGIAVFVVINIWFIIPMFGEFGRLNKKREDAQNEITRYEDEIRKKGLYERQIKELASQGGEVPTEEAALRLAQEVNAQAALTGVTLNNISPVNRGVSVGRTNAFYDEASVTISVNSGEKEFIDFLYRLAQNDLLIRAKSMNIQPDVPARQRIQGNLTLVKSFQRKTPPKAAPVGSGKTTNTPAKAPARPASAPPSAPPPSTTSTKPKK